MLPAIRKEALLALLTEAAATSGKQVTTGLGFVSSTVTSAIASQAQAVSDHLESWTAGGSSTLKVISGDFQPGRAIIVMDGLKLRNRGGAFELVPFAAIAKVEKLHSEKRGSTFEKMKGAAAGSIVGGGVGAAAGAFAFMRTGPLGAAVGGTLGALLSVKHRYNICRVTLRDERKLVAVAENSNWLALLASIPPAEKRGIGRLFGR